MTSYPLWQKPPELKLIVTTSTRTRCANSVTWKISPLRFSWVIPIFIPDVPQSQMLTRRGCMAVIGGPWFETKGKEEPRHHSTTHIYGYGLSAATPVPSIISLRFVLTSVNKSVKICTLFSQYQRGHRPNGNSPLNQRSKPNLCGRKIHLVHCSSLLVTKIIFRSSLTCCSST